MGSGTKGKDAYFGIVDMIINLSSSSLGVPASFGAGTLYYYNWFFGSKGAFNRNF